MLNESSHENTEMIQVNELAIKFKLCKIISEERKCLYAVSFSENNGYFATCGSNFASVYQVNAESKGSVKFCQAFIDEDVEEILYSCCWTYNDCGNPLLIVAGLRGILKCINCLTFELEVALLGHGNAVNDVRLHPLNDSIVFSASKDESIRMWNVTTACCICIFAGEKGHRDEVLNIGIHLLGHTLVSTGMDTNILLWNLMDPEVVNAADLSTKHYSSIERQAFKTIVQQIPIFSANQVHADYVDSVLWYGNCLLTKSTKNRIALWSPDNRRYKNAPLIIKEMVMRDNDIWFVRMDVSIPLNIVACGNKLGKIFIYSLSSNNNELESNAKRKKLSQQDEDDNISFDFQGERMATTEPSHPLLVLSTPKCTSTIRQISFSPNSEYLISVCDDGSVFCWRVQID